MKDRMFPEEPSVPGWRDPYDLEGRVHDLNANRRFHYERAMENWFSTEYAKRGPMPTMPAMIDPFEYRMKVEEAMLTIKPMVLIRRGDSDEYTAVDFA